MIIEFDKTKPTIARSAFVASSADIIGNVEIRENASVWFQAVLRGDIEKITIGKKSNIQDGCILHTDPGFPLTLGVNVVVGHGVVLHGCIVEEGTMIGIGATVLSGARIGKGAIVGAGALVTEGIQIGDGQLALGVPARPVGKVNSNQKKRIEQGAIHYVELMKRYSTD